MPEDLVTTTPASASEISRGRGGPSIGAPAGIGERRLAVPAGVDGLLQDLPEDGGPEADDAGPGAHDDQLRPTTRWAQVLDELEARLGAWRRALRGEVPFPDDYRWPEGLARCPATLRGRARAILASQKDIEAELLARRAALGALLHGIGTTERRLPIPLFVDQRS